MKTLSPHFHYTTPGFQPLESEAFILACGPHAISLMARKKEAMSLAFHAFENEAIFESQLNRILEEIPLPPSCNLQGLYFSNKAVLVPTAFFDAQRLLAYTLPVFDVLPSERLLFHAVNSHMVQVFAMPKLYWQAVDNQVGHCTWQHPAGTMIPVYIEQAKKQEGNALFVYVQHGMVAFTLLQGEQVLAQVIPSVENVNDLFYYTALLLEQYPASVNKIYLHGEWTNLADYEKGLNEKGYSLESFTTPHALTISAIPTSALLPSHQMYHSCVS
ncbi:MAG: DUF3822 family protein [Chitinophagaceae bacterium]